MKNPELIIEELPLDDHAEVAAAVAVEEDGDAANGNNGKDADADSSNNWKKGAATLKHLKEQASEDDDAPVGTLTLRQIVGGDYLLEVVRQYLWFIVLVVLLTCVYVGVRYQCQQDIIEISRLEKELVNAKHRAMSSSSNLTEICRQSNVMKALREDEDNKLMQAEQPPYIIDVEGE